MNPYNHNPFATKPTRRELRSEYDANRALADDRREAEDLDPWNEWGTKNQETNNG
jgi:hypothetical protein